MSLIVDSDYHLQSLRLSFLRHLTPTPLVQPTRSSPNPYLRAGGLTDPDRWPELDVQSTPAAAPPTILTSAAQASSSAANVGCTLPAYGAAPNGGATGLRYSATIGRVGGAGMRVSARRPQAAGAEAAGGAGERAHPPSAFTQSTAPKIRAPKSGSAGTLPAIEQGLRRGSDGKIMLPAPGERRSVGFVDPEQSEEDAEGAETGTFDEEEDDDEDDDEEGPIGLASDEEEFDELVGSGQPRSPRLLSAADPSSPATPPSAPLTPLPSAPPPPPPASSLCTRPRGASTSTADADDEDDFTTSSTAAPGAPSDSAPVRPAMLARGSSALSAVSEAPSAVSDTSTAATAPLPRAAAAAPLTPLRSARPSFASSLAKRPLPPRRPATDPPPHSALTLLLSSHAASSPADASSNPFYTLYASVASAGTGIKLRLYFPHSTSPRTPINAEVRKDATCEEVIGYGLYLFCEEDGRGPKEWREDDVRWTAEGWNLRIVEDEGEVDEDFPALDRTRAVSKFSFDELAICEASASQVKANQTTASKIQRRPSRTLAAAPRARPPAPTSAPTPAPGAAAPSNTLLAPPPAGVGGLAASASASGLSKSATAGVSSSLAPSVFLKVSVHATADVSYTTTVSVPSDMYLQDVLEMICAKKHLPNPSDWALLVKSKSLVVPLDRTVESLEGIADLMLVKREYVEADVGLDRGMALARSTDPNASIFKRLSKDPRRMGAGLDFTASYKKYTVNRRILGLVGRHERVLAIDGDYIHIMPSEQKAFLDSFKTSSFHITTVKACKPVKKIDNNFKLDVWRNGKVKRYDFEAESAKQATEIINHIRSLMALYKNERAAVARLAI